MRNKQVFIYNIDDKDRVPYVSCLLRKIWDRRYVCFCTDIDMARQLYVDNPLGGCCAVSCTRNNKNLRAFNEGNNDHLFVTKRINADAEYKDVECLVFADPVATPYTVQTFASKLHSPDSKIYFFAYGQEECEHAKYLSGLTGYDTLTRFHFTRGILNRQKK